MKTGMTDKVGLLCALAAGRISGEVAERYFPGAPMLMEIAIQKGEWLGSLAEVGIAVEEADEILKELRAEDPANVEGTREGQ